jgi:TatA/E family protein of Tat protein translocase
MGVFSGLTSPTHLLVVVGIALLVFGPKQLPKLARRAGRNAREAKHGIASFKEEFEQGKGDVTPLEDADPTRTAAPRAIAEKAVSPSKPE